MTPSGPLKTYQDAEAFLLSLIDYEKSPGGLRKSETLQQDLRRFERLLEQQRNPHRRFAVIHVAGTKGKGSTCAFLASILQACGLRVGLYTSPHIRTFTERIRVQGKPIPDMEFAGILDSLRTHMAKSGAAESGSYSYRTVFELLTATAFLHFARNKVDLAVVETGLGGRLDSTNMFDHVGIGPHVSVITAIGYDHTAILGNTIEKIASEKAGIIHSHSITVLAEQPAEWRQVVTDEIFKRTAMVGAPVAVKARDLVWVKADEPGECGARVRISAGEQSALAGGIASDLLVALKTGIVADSPLTGSHQRDNLQTAVAALLAMEMAPQYAQWRRQHHWDGVTIDCLKQGIETTAWPGRFEIASEADPVVIIDGAHCPLSVKALAETCRTTYPNKKWVGVIGFLKDKLVEKICMQIGELLPLEAAIACQPPNPRSLAASESAAELSHHLHDVAIETIPDIAAAIDRAIAIALESQAGVLVFGSLYSVGIAEEVMVRWKISRAGRTDEKASERRNVKNTLD